MGLNILSMLVTRPCGGVDLLRSGTLATNEDVAARIAELTQELSAAFVTAAEPFAAGVDLTQAVDKC